LPEIAVPLTLRLLTAVALRVPPVIVPAETLPPLNEPPLNEPAEMVAPLIVPLHRRLPLLFVMVQPVDAEPPPRRMSPVLVPPMLTVPVVAASIVVF
jgi:hypothetical protein